MRSRNGWPRACCSTPGAGAWRRRCTSHALPPEGSTNLKHGDTYSGVLRVACATGLVPDWPASRLQGAPVDRLAALMVEHSLRGGAGGPGIVHLDNPDAWSLRDVLRVMLGADAPEAPLPQWLAACREAAAVLPASGLARELFAERAAGVAVEAMFAPLALDTGPWDRLGLRDRLGMTAPLAYWRRLGAVWTGAAG